MLNSLEAKNDTNERDKNFTFTVPEHTLESWMNHLITETRVRPLKNIHYKEFNSSLYANTNENSYEKNVEDEGLKYRDEQMALAANVNATVQQQEPNEVASLLMNMHLSLIFCKKSLWN